MPEASLSKQLSAERLAPEPQLNHNPFHKLWLDIVSCGSHTKLSQAYLTEQKNQAQRAEWAMMHAMKARQEEAMMQQAAAVQAALADAEIRAAAQIETSVKERVAEAVKAVRQAAEEEKAAALEEVADQAAAAREAAVAAALAAAAVESEAARDAAVANAIRKLTAAAENIEASEATHRSELALCQRRLEAAQAEAMVYREEVKSMELRLRIALETREALSPPPISAKALYQAAARSTEPDADEDVESAEEDATERKAQEEAGQTGAPASPGGLVGRTGRPTDAATPKSDEDKRSGRRSPGVKMPIPYKTERAPSGRSPGRTPGGSKALSVTQATEVF